MNCFLSLKKHARKKFFLYLFLPLLLLGSMFFSACQKKTDYFDYLSEERNNLFLARDEEFSLKIYSVRKESPYAADGVVQPTAPRFEAYLVAPSGDKTTLLRFNVDGKEYGGEMSYDNVKGEYFYNCALDVSALSSIECVFTYGEREITLNALSVLTKSTLSPREALKKLQVESPETFTSLTDKYGFSGEIYLRLLYEDSPYYYVGVIDREGNIQAFLLNAETGKVLARREK